MVRHKIFLAFKDQMFFHTIFVIIIKDSEYLLIPYIVEQSKELHRTFEGHTAAIM